jgi:hypothetical protein
LTYVTVADLSEEVMEEVISDNDLLLVLAKFRFSWYAWWNLGP